MNGEFTPQQLLLLAPILALAGGRDLIDGQVGTVISAEYLAVLERYPFGVAMEGARSACRGKEWRPKPFEVEASCNAGLEVLAQKFLDASTNLANSKLTDEDRAKVRAADERDRKEVAQRIGCGYMGIEWSEYQRVRFKDPIQRARIFPKWRSIDDANKRDEYRDLIESMFDSGELPRIGEDPGT